MATTSSEYLLIIRESSPESYEAMTADQRRESMDEWNAWVDSMIARGKVQRGDPLQPGGRVISGARGERVLDGPFAEAKEVVGGYFLLCAENIDEATALAQECPNLKHGMTIEIRPVAHACHVARALGWEGMREPAEA